MEFIKQHEELHDKTNNKFKYKEGRTMGETSSRNLSVNTVRNWFKTQRTRYGKLTRTKSGQTAEKSTKRQTWLKDSFSFLQGHIRRKGVSKSSAFNSAAAATASVLDTSRKTESLIFIFQRFGFCKIIGK